MRCTTSAACLPIGPVAATSCHAKNARRVRCAVTNKSSSLEAFFCPPPMALSASRPAHPANAPTNRPIAATLFGLPFFFPPPPPPPLADASLCSAAAPSSESDVGDDSEVGDRIPKPPPRPRSSRRAPGFPVSELLFANSTSQ